MVEALQEQTDTISVMGQVSPKLVLSDRQQKAVLDATFALDELRRDAFLGSLTLLLADRTEIGDGELFMILRELQREHFHFPIATHAVGRRIGSPLV
jgi:hypothetical protein